MFVFVLSHDPKKKPTFFEKLKGLFAVRNHQTGEVQLLKKEALTPEMLDLEKQKHLMR